MNQENDQHKIPEFLRLADAVRELQESTAVLPNGEWNTK